MTDAPAITVDGSPLTIETVVAVARRGATAELGADARAAMGPARALVEARAHGDDAIYGVNTGFGSLSRHRVDADGIRAMQANLVRSHAAGVGPPLPDDHVRAMMLLLAASLARGHSGARPEVVETLLAMLRAGIHPVVPSRGSVGASGDLAPLAHVALALIGEGRVRVAPPGADRATDAGVSPVLDQDAAGAFAAAGLTPVTLEAKEGLALLNGTHLMAAMGALAIADAEALLESALGAAAMAVDACRATDTPFDDRLHEARGQHGQRGVAAAMRHLLDGSAIVIAHREDDPRVQDPYCLRCIPQVIGAAVDALAHARTIVTRELGAVTDNPLVFPARAGDGDGQAAAADGDILSGGNFHGMPIAMILDQLAIALCPIAGMAERRVYWILAARDSENPITPYLSPQPGLHSGLMIAQYTAAACCNEMQTLAVPACVANLPTSAGIEDYNSFGPTAGHQLRTSLDRLRSVIAIEFLTMAAGLDAQRPLRSSPAVEALHATIRTAVPTLAEDRPPAPDIAAIESLMHADRLRPDLGTVRAALRG